MRKHTVIKKYHFYAGHRNENLEDKCFNLHGHTYYLRLSFELDYNKRTGITMLFDSFDQKVDPLITKLDHSLLIHEKDPLLKYLYNFCIEEKTSLKVTKMDCVTSAENLAKYIYDKLKPELPSLKKVILQETTTSIVIYEPDR